MCDQGDFVWESLVGLVVWNANFTLSKWILGCSQVMIVLKIKILLFYSLTRCVGTANGFTKPHVCVLYMKLSFFSCFKGLIDFSILRALIVLTPFLPPIYEYRFRLVSCFTILEGSLDLLSPRHCGMSSKMSGHMHYWTLYVALLMY